MLKVNLLELFLAVMSIFNLWMLISLKGWFKIMGDELTQLKRHFMGW